MGENFEYEEDFSLLGQEDFEVTNSLKFKSTSNLTDTEKKLYDKVKQYINNVFDNVIDSENWAFQSYGIEICPRCSKTTAYCFHGLNTSSKNEKLKEMPLAIVERITDSALFYCFSRINCITAILADVESDISLFWINY